MLVVWGERSKRCAGESEGIGAGKAFKQINTEHLDRCISTLRGAWEGLQEYEPGEMLYEINRLAYSFMVGGEEVSAYISSRRKVAVRRVASWGVMSPPKAWCMVTQPS